MLYYLVLFFGLFFIRISNAQTEIPSIAIDDSLSIAVVHANVLEDLQGSVDIIYKNSPYMIELSKGETSTSDTYRLIDSIGKSYVLYVVKHPLFQFYIDKPIINEPKRMATLTYTDKDTILQTYAGIELRGSSSLIFPKKTYDINLHTSADGTSNQDLQIDTMRNDDDWILDAIHNEPLRMRSHLSYQLWKEIHTPYYLKREPTVEAGVATRYCEVFINDRYKGVYLVSEQVDRKLLQLKKRKGDTTRGELFQGARYLGASSFETLPQKKNYLLSWGGYDIKYPVPTNTPWDNLYDFTDFVLHSDDTAFAKEISERFQIENVIDYFLFINALRAPDNMGKNIYVARYKEDEPYFYVPWDLDGTFGTIFNGKRIPTTDDFLTNGLLRRLIEVNPDNFIQRFQNRWIALRKDVFKTTALQQRQTDVYTSLKNNLLYEREQQRWPEVIYDQEGLEYMHAWTEKRLLFLDEFIGRMGE
ncbi:CotH kinase family protein [uncultured Dokdonia sp.]|uniref:CotH kinase family protein n=1 Tax=uncultured Dokdonia sp. TaxID=575653 RepID=UPI002631671F|nr:CotH kinase family protein [uncultured Dokdonia sp.]